MLRKIISLQNCYQFEMWYLFPMYLQHIGTLLLNVLHRYCNCQTVERWSWAVSYGRKSYVILYSRIDLQYFHFVSFFFQYIGAKYPCLFGCAPPIISASICQNDCKLGWDQDKYFCPAGISTRLSFSHKFLIGTRVRTSTFWSFLPDMSFSPTT